MLGSYLRSVTLVVCVVLFSTLGDDSAIDLPQCPFWENPANRSKSCNTRNSNIFFVHTSDEGGPPCKVAKCAIESASRLNPDSTIWVLSQGLDMNELSAAFPNVRGAKLDFAELFGLAPRLKDWYALGEWQMGHRFHHLSDALRLALLWSCGGLYLDTDIISVQSFELYPHNTMIGFEDTTGDGAMCNAALYFKEPHHPLVLDLINRFVDDFKPAPFAWNGPQLFSRVWSVSPSTVGVARVPPSVFYPIAWQEAFKFMGKEVRLSNILTKGEDKTLGVHLWQSQIKSQLDLVGTDYLEDTLIGELFGHQCPTTFASALQEKTAERGDPPRIQVQIVKPRGGTQFQSAWGPIAIEVRIDLESENERQAIDEAVLCFHLDTIRLNPCVPVGNPSIQLTPPARGHHLLSVYLCANDECHQPLTTRSLVSFTIDFHDIGM